MRGADLTVSLDKPIGKRRTAMSATSRWRDRGPGRGRCEPGDAAGADRRVLTL